MPQAIIDHANDGTVAVIEGCIADWQEIADNASAEELKAITHEIESITQYLARAAGYFYARDLGHNHEQAVKRSNTVVTSIRRALGFTYPVDDISF